MIHNGTNNSQRGKPTGKAGFTLIELLVVIAIIGILAAIILASLSTARSKGNDAGIQSDLNTVQTQAELYATSNTNTYYVSAANNVCTDTTVVNALKGAQNDSLATSYSTTLTQAETAAVAVCHVATNGSAYAVAFPLNSSAANSWCVDSTGSATLETGAGKYLAASATVCP